MWVVTFNHKNTVIKTLQITTQAPDAGCHIGNIAHRSSMEAKMFSSRHWYPSGHNSES